MCVCVCVCVCVLVCVIKQSSLFIILQVHSTCFGCQPHPSSGIHKIVTTASSTGHIFCAGSTALLNITFSFLSGALIKLQRARESACESKVMES